jgi:hypothetical protein
VSSLTPAELTTLINISTNLNAIKTAVDEILASHSVPSTPAHQLSPEEEDRLDEDEAQYAKLSPEEKDKRDEKDSIDALQHYWKTRTGHKPNLIPVRDWVRKYNTEELYAAGRLVWGKWDKEQISGSHQENYFDSALRGWTPKELPQRPQPCKEVPAVQPGEIITI